MLIPDDFATTYKIKVSDNYAHYARQIVRYVIRPSDYLTQHYLTCCAIVKVLIETLFKEPNNDAIAQQIREKVIFDENNSKKSLLLNICIGEESINIETIRIFRNMTNEQKQTVINNSLNNPKYIIRIITEILYDNDIHFDLPQKLSDNLKVCLYSYISSLQEIKYEDILKLIKYCIYISISNEKQFDDLNYPDILSEEYFIKLCKNTVITYEDGYTLTVYQLIKMRDPSFKESMKFKNCIFNLDLTESARVFIIQKIKQKTVPELSYKG